MRVNVVGLSESFAAQSSPPQGGAPAPGVHSPGYPWVPTLPNPREIPESLQGVLGRPQRFNIGNPSWMSSALNLEPGYVIQQADAKQAYTQALLQGVATWVRLPRNRWPKAWKGMKDPVVLLKLALYGHPDSRGIWERHCETELQKVRFEANFDQHLEERVYHRTKKLLLVVYVDDSKLAGPKNTIKEGWSPFQA